MYFCKYASSVIIQQRQIKLTSLTRNHFSCVPNGQV